jgi:hypothetical protein
MAPDTATPSPPAHASRRRLWPSALRIFGLRAAFFIVVAVLVALAVLAASALTAVNETLSGIVIVGVGAGAALADWGWTYIKRLALRAAQLVAGWAAGLLPQRVRVVVALLATGALIAVLFAESGDRARMIAAAAGAVVLVSLALQYAWFRGRRSRWQAANPGG